MERTENRLRKIYYDRKNSASFGSVNKLYRAAKAVSRDKLTRKDIRDWLRSQAAYTLHKPTRKNFLLKVFVGGTDDQFESDLCDFQSLAAFNDNYRFLLACFLSLWCTAKLFMRVMRLLSIITTCLRHNPVGQRSTV